MQKRNVIPIRTDTDTKKISESLIHTVQHIHGASVDAVLVSGDSVEFVFTARDGTSFAVRVEGLTR